MERLSFLTCFTSFSRLLKERDITLPFTGLKLSLVPTLFNVDDLVVNGEVYSTLELTDKEVFERIVPGLFEVLAAEERFYLLKEAMDLSSVWNFESFQRFARCGEYEGEFSYAYFKFDLLFWDRDEPGEYMCLDALQNCYTQLKNLQVYFVEDEHSGFEFTGWMNDPSLRLKVLTGTIVNPNLSFAEHVLEFFNREEALEVAAHEMPVSTHYSVFEDNRIAFNVKVHEDFAHEELFKLKLISYEMENENRQETLQDMIDNIECQTDFKFIEQTGRSGGYVIFECDCLTPQKVRELSKMIEDAKTSAHTYYQTLEAYSHLFDDFLEELEHLKEEEDGNENDIDSLIYEIQNYGQTVH